MRLNILFYKLYLFYGVVGLVMSTYVTSLMLEASDRFKGLTATILALGHWSLWARPRRLSDCHQQRQADSGMEAVTAAHRWLAPAAVVVVRWSNDLNVIFSMFELPCTYCELME
jgi:hypothetical protein